VFGQCGLGGEQIEHALRLLRHVPGKRLQVRLRERMRSEALAVNRGEGAMQSGGAAAEQIERDAVGAHRVGDVRLKRGAGLALPQRDRLAVALKMVERPFPRRSAARHLLLQHRHRRRRRAVRLILRPCHQRRDARLDRTRAEATPNFNVGILAGLEPSKHFEQIPVAEEGIRVALLERGDMRAQLAGIVGERRRRAVGVTDVKRSRPQRRRAPAPNNFEDLVADEGIDHTVVEDACARARQSRDHRSMVLFRQRRCRVAGGGCQHHHVSLWRCVLHFHLHDAQIDNRLGVQQRPVEEPGARHRPRLARIPPLALKKTGQRIALEQHARVAVE
jgi:hypothetical protein